LRAHAAAVVLLLLPAVVWPQSLGEVARQEAERRKKVQSEGKATPVAGDDALEKAGAARRHNEDTSDAPAASSATRAEDARAQAPSPGVSADTTDLDRERAARERNEQLWRRRVADANARLERARTQYDAVKDMSLAPGQALVDQRGRVVVHSPQELQRIVAEAEAELRAAEKAIEELADAAQREGVPPGWLR
jgi:hypothetical protein